MYVGLDVHKEFVQACEMDEQGRVVKEEKIRNERGAIESFFRDIPRARVVIESSSTWYNIYSQLSDRYDVVVSNPVKTWISKNFSGTGRVSCRIERASRTRSTLYS